MIEYPLNPPLGNLEGLIDSLVEGEYIEVLRDGTTVAVILSVDEYNDMIGMLERGDR